ncbi:MAG: GNAT family N-acetyltransferase [Actinobacteria bacterium]|nr:GNAT family N-acetyltransferase [Actinomycetota bacterium]MCB0920554.1 GNAT family N-acetyltransferase [Actinomycetota bacterium]TXH32725.1 MAG: GNAT family N-acetyltransferase [Actinomycetota bacterium]
MNEHGLLPFTALDAEHQAAVRHVYESSFPLALRAPWEEIIAGRPDEELLVLLDDGSRETPPVGLVLVRHLGTTSMSFLRYFVVDAQRRGRGHGSRLWSTLVDHLRDQECSMLLLDVEDPDDRPHDSPERRDDLRRIDFYERHGVHMLAVREYAPPDHGQDGEEPSLLLMGCALAGSGGVPRGPAPEGQALREAVIAVYRDRYGLEPDDPVVRTTLQASRL